MSWPRAVLLDLDNTVYPYEPCHEAGLRAARAVAAPLLGRWRDEQAFLADYTRARRLVKQRTGGQATAHSRLLYFKSMLETALGHTAVDPTLELEAAYWRGYFATMRPDPACPELLAELRAHGVRTAWLSNFTTERQMLKLGALGLQDALDFLVTSGEADCEKPDRRLFDLALGMLGTEASQTWMVGDDPRDDIVPALERGLTAVWLDRDGQGGDGGGATHVVRDWRELRELLERA